MTKYSIINKTEPVEDINKQIDKEIEKQFDSYAETILPDSELPTKKQPVYNFTEKKTKSNPNLTYEPIRIAIFKCKQEYEDFYPLGIHGAIMKAENNFVWFAVPIKEPYCGTIEWSKAVWEKIYEFEVTVDLFL